QTWLNKVRQTCQCCSQGIDARRPEVKRRCCARGKCCGRYPSAGTIVHLRRILRTVLSQAMTDGLVTRNVASSVKLPSVRRRARRKAPGRAPARPVVREQRGGGAFPRVGPPRQRPVLRRVRPDPCARSAQG